MKKEIKRKTSKTEKKEKILDIDGHKIRDSFTDLTREKKMEILKKMYSCHRNVVNLLRIIL